MGIIDDAPWKLEHLTRYRYSPPTACIRAPEACVLVQRTSMYSQFSLVRFSSVALSTTSSKAFVCARNMLTVGQPRIRSGGPVVYVQVFRRRER